VSEPIYRDQLEAVYALLEDPRRWTQEFFARTAYGDGIDDDFDCNEEGESLSDDEQACHHEAVCWCLYGAAYKCGIYNDGAYARALGMNEGHEVANFNDSHTHAEVLSLLRSAIERAPVRSPPSTAGVV